MDLAAKITRIKRSLKYCFGISITLWAIIVGSFSDTIIEQSDYKDDGTYWFSPWATMDFVKKQMDLDKPNKSENTKIDLNTTDSKNLKDFEDIYLVDITSSLKKNDTLESFASSLIPTNTEFNVYRNSIKEMPSSILFYGMLALSSNSNNPYVYAYKGKYKDWGPELEVQECGNNGKHLENIEGKKDEDLYLNSKSLFVLEQMKSLNEVYKAGEKINTSNSKENEIHTNTSSMFKTSFKKIKDRFCKNESNKDLVINIISDFNDDDSSVDFNNKLYEVEEAISDLGSSIYQLNIFVLDSNSGYDKKRRQFIDYINEVSNGIEIYNNIHFIVNNKDYLQDNIDYFNSLIIPEDDKIIFHSPYSAKNGHSNYKTNLKILSKTKYLIQAKAYKHTESEDVKVMKVFDSTNSKNHLLRFNSRKLFNETNSKEGKLLEFSLKGGFKKEVDDIFLEFNSFKGQKIKRYRVKFKSRLPSSFSFLFTSFYVLSYFLFINIIIYKISSYRIYKYLVNSNSTLSKILIKKSIAKIWSIIPTFIVIANGIFWTILLLNKLGSLLILETWFTIILIWIPISLIVLELERVSNKNKSIKSLKYYITRIVIFLGVIFVLLICKYLKFFSTEYFWGFILGSVIIGLIYIELIFPFLSKKLANNITDTDNQNDNNE